LYTNAVAEAVMRGKNGGEEPAASDEFVVEEGE